MDRSKVIDELRLAIARGIIPEARVCLDIGLSQELYGRTLITVADLLGALESATGAIGSFQARVGPWMHRCFGPEISADRLERGDRLLEEVLELLQSGSYPRERVAALVGYVYGRPIGEPFQEVGGVMVTLAAYCLAHQLDMHEAGEIELARILQPEIVAKIRAKQAAKPTGSALPVAAQDDLPADVARLVIAARIVADEDQGSDALRELDEASAAFADRVPWEGERAEDLGLNDLVQDVHYHGSF